MGAEPKKSVSIGRVIGALKDITNVTREEKLKIISRIRELSRSAAKELAKDIRAMAAKGQITTAQATNIISKFADVNMLNETSVSNFVDYMTNVFANVKEKNRQSLLNDLLKLVSQKAKAAKTEYVVLCEDDCLYTREHFTCYRPPKNLFGYNHNKWGLYVWEKNPIFSYKFNRSVLSQCIAPRKLLIESLTERFNAGIPENETTARVFAEPGRYERHFKRFNVTIH
jgi:hypothetical protein